MLSKTFIHTLIHAFSALNRPGNPDDSGHPFQGKPAGHSRAKQATFLGYVEKVAGMPERVADMVESYLSIME